MESNVIPSEARNLRSVICEWCMCNEFRFFTSLRCVQNDREGVLRCVQNDRGKRGLRSE